MTTLTTTAALAAELGAPIADIAAYVDQLIDLDGRAAVIAAETALRNGSGRVIGTEITLTKKATEFIRGMYAAAATQDTTPLYTATILTSDVDSLAAAVSAGAGTMRIIRIYDHATWLSNAATIGLDDAAMDTLSRLEDHIDWCYDGATLYANGMLYPVKHPHR
jgi:hypothetical protein